MAKKINTTYEDSKIIYELLRRRYDWGDHIESDQFRKSLENAKRYYESFNL